MKKSLVLILAAALAACVPVKPTMPPGHGPPPPDTPVPIPSGARLAFISDRDGYKGHMSLCLLDLETQEILIAASAFDAAYPKWSPDGSRILFIRTDDGTLNIFSAEGSHSPYARGIRVNFADWSPEGSRIVFESDYQDEQRFTPDIYIIGSELKDPVKLPVDTHVINYNPLWLGEKILFISKRAGTTEIRMMNVDGSEVMRVMELPGEVFHAAVSPDGERLAYTARQSDGSLELFVVHLGGALDTLIRLTEDGADDDGAAWSTDGREIYFFSNRSGNYDLWRINADGTDPVQLTDDAYYDAFPDYWSE